MVSRRRTLSGLIGLGAAAALPAIARASPLMRLVETRFAGLGQTHLWVRQVAGPAEERHVRFRTADGRLVPEGVEALSWLWRDWRDGDAAVWIDYRLFDVLAWIQTAATLEDDRPICLTLSSGFRTARRNATLKGAARASQHIVGRAADVTLDGVDIDRLARLADRAGAGGVGRYRRFVHVDTGWEGRRWGA
jgi:uncharacterized protein YcbK (DUF882 family)